MPDTRKNITGNAQATATSNACPTGSTDMQGMLRRDEVVPRICEIVAEKCGAAFGNRMTSLILTGSAARNEVTILKDAARWKIAGDAEFMALVRQEAKTDGRAAASVSGESSRELSKHGIDASVDVAVVTAPYFQSLPPHIFSYELRTCGKIIAGDSNALSLIPEFSAAHISREDAWRLVCNRMIEQLQFVDDLETSTSELTPRLEYATVKLYLDMATSYLVFAGQYAPTYRERAERLAALVKDPNRSAPFPLSKFAARVAECTSWKLSGEEAFGETRSDFWPEAISYMRRLWRWEMIQLTDASGELTVSGLAHRLAKQQKADLRVRAWMSAAKRNGWLKSTLQLPGWMRLARRSTPRYSVYQVAAEIAFRLPCLLKHNGQPPRLDVNWRALRGLLPVRAPQPHSSSRPAWRQVTDDVLWNYSRLLRSTRA